MTCRIVLLCLGLYLGCFCPLQAQDDEKAFNADYAKVLRFTKINRWTKAGDLLDDLLTKHASAPYVFSRRREILEYLERCAFHSKYPDAKPKDVVSGDLKSYDPKRGTIKITYNGNFRDFERSNGLRIHKARLTGPATIEVSGPKHPIGKQLMVMIDSYKDNAYTVLFGCEQENDSWFPARLRGLKNGKWVDLDYKEISPVKGGKKFKFKIKVKSTSIQASYNNRGYLQGKKKRNHWGYWGFDDNTAVDKVTLKGAIQPAWIKGLIDEKRQKDRATFASDFRIERVAPRWLLNGRPPVAKVKKVKRDDRAYPGELTPSQHEALKSMRDLATFKNWELALKKAEALSPEIPQATRSWFLALYQTKLDKWDLALKNAGISAKLDPTFYESGSMWADLLTRSGRKEEARKVWRSLLKSHPQEAYSYSSLAYLLMEHNELPAADAVIKDAIKRGLRSRQIKALEDTLFRASHGPKWQNVYHWKSRHYEVHTDIDKKTAEDASRILEKAFTAYSTYMGRTKTKAPRRFQVYIFSGEAGYHEYVRSLIGTPKTHTAGLYFPLLKQLLIWNLPDRKSMLKTVQHEGFHQYVDSITEEMPNWLNEGTAEYYETATSGRWSNTPIRKDHLSELAGGVRDLGRFVRISYRDFYGSASFNYARAWALVYFLRHSTPTNKKVLTSLHDKLKSGMTSKKAIEEVFGQLDMKALKVEMEAFLDELRKR